jgi:ribonucleoside-diphosphate reductase alpha chain
MAILGIQHPDIIEFIHSKTEEGKLANFNISVALTDEFMQAVESESTQPWRCHFNGVEYPLRRIVRDEQMRLLEIIEEPTMTASQLFDEILTAAHSNGTTLFSRSHSPTLFLFRGSPVTLYVSLIGEPGCVFIDTVNKANPLPGLGPLLACNPCASTRRYSSVLKTC